MKALKIARDIVPIGEFKGKAARWLRQADQSGEPVVITKNGRPAGVLLSPVEFDRLTERQRFLESVAAGAADADAGRVMDTAGLRRRLDLPRTRPRTR